MAMKFSVSVSSRRWVITGIVLTLFGNKNIAVQQVTAQVSEEKKVPDPPFAVVEWRVTETTVEKELWLGGLRPLIGDSHRLVPKEGYRLVAVTLTGEVRQPGRIWWSTDLFAAVFSRDPSGTPGEQELVPSIAVSLTYTEDMWVFADSGSAFGCFEDLDRSPVSLGVAFALPEAVTSFSVLVPAFVPMTSTESSPTGAASPRLTFEVTDWHTASQVLPEGTPAPPSGERKKLALVTMKGKASTACTLFFAKRSFLALYPIGDDSRSLHVAPFLSQKLPPGNWPWPVASDKAYPRDYSPEEGTLEFQVGFVLPEDVAKFYVYHWMLPAEGRAVVPSPESAAIP
jgi:hypothetical protein